MSVQMRNNSHDIRSQSHPPEAAVWSSPVYLDHHATTPVDPRVVKVVCRMMTETFGNPNSVDHLFGEAAAAIVEGARGDVARLVGAPPEHVRFTSGATEAIRIAIGIARANAAPTALRVAVSRAEHKAVLDTLSALERDGQAVLHWIDVDAMGRVSLSDVAGALSKGIDLLCLMAANNEVGTLHPVRQIADLAREAGVAILVDATQAVGRVPLDAADWGIDYLILSAHKLYGPKGAGALVGPEACTPVADHVCGHVGTPNVPGVAGLGAACQLRLAEASADEERIAMLRDRLEEALVEHVPGLVVNGDRANRLSNNLHVSAPGAPNDAVVARLRRRVAISTGAACSSGAQAPSHVLQAMGLPVALQDSALRISPGKFNTIDEIDRAAAEIATAIADVRMMMGTR
jgi:cysteine desulfurase